MIIKNIFLPLWRASSYCCRRQVHYIQGQSPERRVREYFYFIDHQGQLFLDDARIKNFTSCFKEKKFLHFFFSRVERNSSERYRETFPFISLCGRERNFIHCDDVPIVFTTLLPGTIVLHQTSQTDTSSRGSKSDSSVSDSFDRLSYGGAGDLLTFPFNPTEISMLPLTGRVYHPAPEKAGGVGLVKSAVAIELSKHFEFGNGEGLAPTHFHWRQNRYELSNNVLNQLELLKSSTNYAQ